MATDRPPTGTRSEAAGPGLPVSRRGAIASVALAGVGAAALTACGGVGTRAAAVPTGPTALGPASAVPVGGGHVYTGQNVVVTQPTAGHYKCFSATCTHEGCQVNQVQDGFITCPCHGSQFAIADGAPTADSPATRPLPSVPVSVQGGNLVAD